MTTKIDNKKRFQNFVRSIEKSNDKFKDASPSQKILMVAKDVLSLLELSRIKAETGIYMHIPRNQVEIQNNCQMSDLLKMPDLPTCQVCAIGGAMLACTLRLNKVKIADPHYVYVNYQEYNYAGLGFGMSNRAREVFPNLLLRFMEEAFESDMYGYHRFSSDQGRLRAIYQNLVDNKGKKFTWHGSKNKVIYSVQS